jgi:hypothetical protein
MRWKTTKQQSCLRFIAVLILVVGLGSAIVIYLTAEKASDNSLADDLASSKKYHHDLELYGGEMNVLLDQFGSWFSGLWHGESLAYTIVFITVAASTGFWFVARFLSVESTHGEEKRDRAAS